MTEQEMIEAMKPGDFFVDNSKHKYNGKCGYQWVAVNKQSVIKKGVERKKDYAFGAAISFASQEAAHDR